MAYDGTKPADSSAEVAAEIRTNQAALSRRLNTDFTARQNSLAALTDLSSYSVPGGTLDENGRALRITAAGYFAANGNNKLINFVFGATTFSILGSGAYNAVRWKAVIEVTRKTATTQVITGYLIMGGGTLGFGGSGAWTTAGETLSGAVTAKMQGQGTASADVVEELFLVEVL